MVSRSKRGSHAGLFFRLFLTKCLSKCPSSKPSLSWKISGCAPDKHKNSSEQNIFECFKFNTFIVNDFLNEKTQDPDLNLLYDNVSLIDTDYVSREIHSLFYMSVSEIEIKTLKLGSHLPKMLFLFALMNDVC